MDCPECDRHLFGHGERRLRCMNPDCPRYGLAVTLAGEEPDAFEDDLDAIDFDPMRRWEGND
jgi:hypothetical protein